jgi:hypothetical protein
MVQGRLKLGLTIYNFDIFLIFFDNFDAFMLKIKKYFNIIFLKNYSLINAP